MIPILYDKDEVAFVSNGLGRLRDCTECTVTEERNGIYECDFSYPMSGANFDLIQVGRIIGVTHDESGDIEPFDIVSYERPIDGVVTFHCVHISYRLSYMTVKASSVNSLSAAFTAFGNAQPSMPFSFDTDKTSTGFVAGFDGLPHTVRSLMGGTEGSILDAYGGEYSFNNWQVYLHSARGQFRDFAIRYGVNMLDYNEEYDTQGTFSSCIPYWTDGTDKVVGDKVDGSGSTITGRGECVPLDLSDKFESKPTKAQVETEAAKYLSSNNTSVPKQTIEVNFVRLQDMGYENLGALMQCNLCDTIKVIFPDYNSSGTYKIVKTVWNVLENRYEEMELGQLSTTLAEALGIDGLSGSENRDGHSWKTLWSGSFNSDTLQVSGLRNYHAFEITFSGAATHALCFAAGSGATGYLRGTGSYCTTTTITDYIVGLNVDWDTETISWVNCVSRQMNISSKAITTGSLTISSIIGID